MPEGSECSERLCQPTFIKPSCQVPGALCCRCDRNRTTSAFPMIRQQASASSILSTGSSECGWRHKLCGDMAPRPHTAAWATVFREHCVYYGLTDKQTSDTETQPCLPFTYLKRTTQRIKCQCCKCITMRRSPAKGHGLHMAVGFP